MSAPESQDNAPWWVKELRVWGIGGFALFALGWFGMKVYENQENRLSKQDAQIQEQQEKSTTAIQNNTAAMQQLKEAIREGNKP